MRNKRRIVVIAKMIATLAFSVNTVCTRSAPTQTPLAAINEDSTQLSGVAIKDVRAFCVSGHSLFVGSYDGGVFRSNDNGESWTAVNSGIPTTRGRPGPCILSFAVSGSNIFAGTGYDQGVFLSTDNGESWTAVNAVLPFKSPLTSLSISPLFVHGNAIFAGTESEGVIISTDNGKSWKAAGSGLATYVSSGYTWKYGATSFVECGGDLFAGTYGGVFRLTQNCDGTIKWTTVSSGLEGTALYVVKLAQQGGSIFAATLGGVYRSSDKGASWKLVSSDIADYLMESVFAGDNRVFASTQWSTFLSTNNGANWTEIKSALSGQDVRTFFQSGNTIFAGTQIGGIFRSSDSGNTWTACNTVLLH